MKKNKCIAVCLISFFIQLSYAQDFRIVDKTIVDSTNLSFKSEQELKNIVISAQWFLSQKDNTKSTKKKYVDLTAYLNKGKTNQQKGIGAVLTVGPNCDYDYSQMQQAIDDAAFGDDIHVAGGTYSSNNARFNIVAKSLTVIGGWSQNCQFLDPFAPVTIFELGATSDEVVDILPQTQLINVDLINLVLKSGSATGGGMFIHAGTGSGKATVNLLNSVISNNQGSVAGGLRVIGATLNIGGFSSINNNQSLVHGGGINCSNSEINISNATIANNIADFGVGNTGKGGGIYLDNCDLNMTAYPNQNSTVSGNTAIDGAGIYAKTNSSIFLEGQNVNVINNIASFDAFVGGSGGGIYSENSSVVMNAANVSNNQAYTGAGIYVGFNATLITGRTLGDQCDIAQCTRIQDNVATSVQALESYGGGITSESTASSKISHTWLTGNQAQNSSAISMSSNSGYIRHSMIYNNTSTSNISSATNPSSIVTFPSGTELVFKFNTLANNKINANEGAIVKANGEIVAGEFNANIIQNNVFTGALAISKDLFVSNTNSQIQCEYNLLETINTFGYCNSLTNLDGGIEAMFMDAANSNFHITSASLAVDHASIATSTSEKDIDNELIPIGSADSGADEALAKVGINGETCSLNTINDALNIAIPGDVIYISPGVYNETLDIVIDDLQIVGASDNCASEIVGDISDTVMIDGTGITISVPLVQLSSTNDITFKNLTIQNSSSRGIYIQREIPSLGVIILDNTTIKNNTTTQFGAGIYLSAVARIELINHTKIYNNQTASITGQGGGLYVKDGSLNIYNDSEIGMINQANQAAKGGGIYIENGFLRLFDNSQIDANLAEFGAGIYASSGTQVELSNNVVIGGLVAGNVASIDGGGIYMQDSSSALSIIDTTVFENNSANTGSGGAVYSPDGAHFSAQGALFKANTAHLNGGGVYIDYGSDIGVPFINWITLNFFSNQANHGGAVYLKYGQAANNLTINMPDANFVANQALSANGSDGKAGGLYIDGGFDINLSNVIFQSNTSTGDGGVAYVTGDTKLVIESSTIVNSRAENNGGALLLNNMDTTLINTNLISNQSISGNGGAVFSSNTSGDFIFQSSSATNDSIVSQNKALNGKGGAFYLYSGDNGGERFSFLANHITNQSSLNISGNQAQRGGSIYIDSPLVDLLIAGRITIQDNASTEHGGAVYNNGGDLKIIGIDNTRLKIINNHAQQIGGVIYQSSGSLQMLGVQVGEIGAGNTSGGNGGAIYLRGNCSMISEDSVFDSNISGFKGGAVYVSADSFFSTGHKLLITDSNFNCNQGIVGNNEYCNSYINNQANTQGGAIYNLGSTTLNKTAFLKNSTVVGLGSAIYSTSGAVTDIYDSLIALHSSSDALWFGTNSDTLINNITIAENLQSIHVHTQASIFDISNSIIWGDNNAGELNITNSGSCNIDEFGIFSGNSSDPLFITDSNNNDYKLSNGSPAIDACNSNGGSDMIFVNHNTDGNNLPSSNESDMGAFEYQLTGNEPYNLAIVRVGNGTISSNPAGINCGNTCNTNFPQASTVTLQAVADNNWQFVGWSGAGCSGTGSCVITMNQAKSVTATFTGPEAIFSDGFE